MRMKTSLRVKVFKNAPMGGGRGGNVRERMYQRMGFGDVLDDDYQYGYKPYSDEGVPAPKLKPMDSSTGFTMFNEEQAMDRFQDDVYSVMEDEPGMFAGGFDRDVVQSYIDSAMEYGDIDLRDYSRSEIRDLVNQAREYWADENAIEELQGRIFDNAVVDEIEDDYEKDEFADFVTDYVNDLSPMDAMDMISADEMGELDDTMRDLYNKFLQSRGAHQMIDQAELEFFLEEFPELDPEEVEELLELLAEEEQSEGRAKKSKNYTKFKNKDKDERDPMTKIRDNAISKLNTGKGANPDD